MRFVHSAATARFVSRPNRFRLDCDLDGRRVRAYLPNPGRLWELLFPGVRLWLEKAGASGRLSGSGRRRLAYTAVAVERGGRPVLLHTHRNNDVAAHLIERGLVPGLEGARVAAREVTRGRSRFDFLLRQGGKDVVLEVKSCTLFSARAAMFPDAVTGRGTRHLEELAALADGRTGAAVLFIIHAPHVDVFMPEFHRDPEFARALLAVRETVQVIPLAVGWGRDLSLEEETRLVPIPWEKVEREAGDRGSYLVIVRLRRRRTLEVGRLGAVRFAPGYYVYAGSAMRNLAKRIERHRRLRKRMHWHIDHLRAAAEWRAAVPIAASESLECGIAAALRNLAGEGVPGFGSSDCSCPSHLFRMDGDPLRSRDFHAILQHFMMDRVADQRGGITPEGGVKRRR